MVNCKNCGAPLRLEDAFCPHCGTPNPEAQEHLKKLAELDKDVESAKQEVAEEVKKSKKGYGLLIIMVMLLLANLLAFAMHLTTYEIAEKIIASKMSETQIKAQLDSLMDQGEYIEMSVFMDKFNLPYKDYSEYNKISYMAEYYNRIIKAMTEYLYNREPYDDPLVTVCSNVIDYEQEYTMLKKRDNERSTLYHIERLNDEVENYLKTYLKLTDEDIEGLADMNYSGLLLLVNERLSYEEE
ncbi:MAG: zinc ribbon domain-containing protein [Firmicutes bacterium]|nr:zinc ribbon domain-containing protein [Bacillota bacterium]